MAPDVHTGTPKASSRVNWRTPLAALIFAGSLALLLAATMSMSGGTRETTITLAVAACFGLLLVITGLRSPNLAVLYLLAAMFLRLVLPEIPPADPFVLAFGGVIVSYGLLVSSRRDAVPSLGWTEAAMFLYLFWNVYSMFANHDLGAVYPLNDEVLSVHRFILTGTAIPFTLYFVGRSIYPTENQVRTLLWAVVAFGSYSGLVSIFQFHGPRALVWPPYIIDSPGWAGRANGIFNQPAVNGLTLIAGFLAAILIASQPGERRSVRIVTAVVAAVCSYGVFLTHTRAIWLAFGAVVLAGLIFARGMRIAFGTTLAAGVGAVAMHWSTFTGSDRAEGGVRSVNEVHDRLNTIETSFWAFGEKPWFGWGIGRFTALNTYHHKQWAPDIPWLRGFGISSHMNELGILVELGIVGLVLWLGVLALVIAKLVKAIRILPTQGLGGRNLALIALFLLGVLIVTGFTVDLRFFDFPNALVLLLAGVAVGFADRAIRLRDSVDRVDA
ncbi:O-antigen ligase family protein [Aldersonia kunmingensis]|uniref:O-antigen ligase family protein n=1 Tax=Aldersonia kunmingensis TaxID=408066 RepID=UPI00082EE5AA|nr:O-antigen ligase family protein [Aldersonia kunmingensis]